MVNKPHNFNTGDLIVASKFNENFDTIYTAFNSGGGLLGVHPEIVGGLGPDLTPDITAENLESGGLYDGVALDNPYFTSQPTLKMWIAPASSHNQYTASQGYKMCNSDMNDFLVLNHSTSNAGIRRELTFKHILPNAVLVNAIKIKGTNITGVDIYGSNDNITEDILYTTGSIFANGLTPVDSVTEQVISFSNTTTYKVFKVVLRGNPYDATSTDIYNVELGAQGESQASTYPASPENFTQVFDTVVKKIKTYYDGDYYLADGTISNP